MRTSLREARARAEDGAFREAVTAAERLAEARAQLDATHGSDHPLRACLCAVASLEEDCGVRRRRAAPQRGAGGAQGGPLAGTGHENGQGPLLRLVVRNHGSSRLFGRPAAREFEFEKPKPEVFITVEVADAACAFGTNNGIDVWKPRDRTSEPIRWPNPRKGPARGLM